MRKIPETATELFACGKAAGDWMFVGKTYRLLPNAIAAEKYIYEEEKAKKIKRENRMKWENCRHLHLI